MEKETPKFEKAIKKGLETSGKILSPGKADKKNISLPLKSPQTLLSKEQRMLQALFNEKNQLWGNGEPVKITRHLMSGGGLLKTGTGDQTRRLLW